MVEITGRLWVRVACKALSVGYSTYTVSRAVITCWKVYPKWVLASFQLRRNVNKFIDLEIINICNEQPRISTLRSIVHTDTASTEWP